MNLYHVTKFSPYSSLTVYCFYTKISEFMLVLSTRIVLDCFYLLIFYSEKFSTDVRRLPYAVNVNLNLSCNDRALLARCLRHIQSVFNLIVDILMDIHVMVNWQLSKRVSADQCNLTVSLAHVYKLIELTCFLKLFADQLLVLIDCSFRSIMKRPYNK